MFLESLPLASVCVECSVCPKVIFGWSILIQSGTAHVSCLPVVILHGTVILRYPRPSMVIVPLYLTTPFREVTSFAAFSLALHGVSAGYFCTSPEGAWGFSVINEESSR